jgi:RNA recognition motif-containing protein
MGTRLYVGNLPYSASEQQIQEFIETSGSGGRRVTEVKIVMDRDTGRPRGFAFVEVTEPQMVQTAISQLHGADFGGRTIVVNEAKEPQRGSSRTLAARTASRRT